MPTTLDRIVLLYVIPRAVFLILSLITLVGSIQILAFDASADTLIWTASTLGVISIMVTIWLTFILILLALLIEIGLRIFFPWI